MKLFAALFAIFAIQTCIGQPAFSYDDNKPNGPSNWGRISPACDGDHQSPIDICSALMEEAESYSSLTVFNLNVPSTSIEISNAGHGPSIELHYANGVKVEIFGGPLREPYVLKNFHLHWPSEHTLDGRQFDGEIHLVHYNKKYESFENASMMSDGLAVLGFFLEIDDITTEKQSTPYVKLLKNVYQPYANDTDSVLTDQMNLAQIIGTEPIYVSNYDGSLTTPPCSENVIWMIATRTLRITNLELVELQKVKFDDGHKTSDNFRPIQPLCGREILIY